MNSRILNIIKQNIDLARTAQKGRRIVAVVSGSESDRESWESRLIQSRKSLFGPGAEILSLVEEIEGKTREGNFLGTLLAFRRIREWAESEGIDYREGVVLLGMIFGRGERMSPFTQIEGNRKPAIIVNAGYGTSGARMPLTAIEESLLYFSPVTGYLEKGGFRGILDKWGDETEIPSLPLAPGPADELVFRDDDIIKFVSVMRIEGELAAQKDWVVFDGESRILAQLCRGKREVLEKQLMAMGILPGPDGVFSAGVSLGPVAVSYPVLELAEEIFGEEISRPGVYFDFDPYFMMAVTMPPDRDEWKKCVSGDSGLQALVEMVPAFFEKIISLKKRFEQRYGRPLKARVFDLGASVYWADIGQHEAMARKYLALKEDTFWGEIARYLEGVPSLRDEQGNIIIDSRIAPGVDVRGSVVLGSDLLGSGIVRGSVIKDSVLRNPVLEEAFAVLSRRRGERLVLPHRSGIYKSLGDDDLVLPPGRRSGTLLTQAGPVELQVEESTNLRRREDTYNRPILGNKYSFSEAYSCMQEVSMDELWLRRQRILRGRGLSCPRPRDR